jgi:hypothetical protein
MAKRNVKLTAVEKGKFHAYWTATLQEYQQTYFQIQSGLMDAQIQDGWWQMLRNNVLSPGFRLHWEQRNFVLFSKFREFVETEVMRGQPTPGLEAAVLRRETDQEG